MIVGLINLVAHAVRRAGAPVKLTSREYRLLSQLVGAAGRVVTHKQLVDGVWGAGCDDNIQYLRVLIQHLRQKLEPEPSAPRHILNESRVGYRFVA